MVGIIFHFAFPSNTDSELCTATLTMAVMMLRFDRMPIAMLSDESNVLQFLNAGISVFVHIDKQMHDILWHLIWETLAIFQRYFPANRTETPQMNVDSYLPANSFDRPEHIDL